MRLARDCMPLPLRSTSGMTSRGSTRVSCVVKASRERRYAALVDPDVVARCRFSTGMSIVVDQFEPREGGQVRVWITYASSGVGKTKERMDTYRRRFVELVSNERRTLQPAGTRRESVLPIADGDERPVI